MQVYSGASDIIWAVTRVGGDQIAATTADSVCIWGSDPSQPAQVLPATTAHDHSGIDASPDGKWLIRYGRKRIQSWRQSGSEWALHSDLFEPGLLVARFLPTTGVAAKVMLATRPMGGIEIYITHRKFDASKGGGFEEGVASFSASPARLSTGVNLNEAPYFATDFSADGRWFLLSPCDREAHLWDANEGRHHGMVKLRSISNGAAISPDGAMFAIDGGTTVYFWDTLTLKLLASWRVKHCYTPALAWSPDSRHIARADGSTTVRVFDPGLGQEVSALSAKNHRATAVAFSPDGLTYLTGTFRGHVVAWDVG